MIEISNCSKLCSGLVKVVIEELGEALCEVVLEFLCMSVVVVVVGRLLVIMMEKMLNCRLPGFCAGN